MTIGGVKISEIGHGLLVLVGVTDGDLETDASWLSGKIAQMRIFPDSEGKMNRSVVDNGGDILVVSQFTLHASTKKGNRPSFLKAAPAPISEPLYEEFCSLLEREIRKPVQRGRFGADMQVALVNDGPVTIFIDSQRRE